MLDVSTAAKYLGAFGGGVVVAGFFLSGPVERPGHIQTYSPAPAVQSPANVTQATMPGPAPQESMQATSSPVQQQQAPAEETIESRTIRTIPVTRPNDSGRETVGAGDRGRAAPDRDVRDYADTARNASAQAARCDVSACSRKYRSFDEATCTYQPYHGGARRLCER